MVAVKNPDAKETGVETHIFECSYNPSSHSGGKRHLSIVKFGIHNDNDFTGASDAITLLNSTSDETSGTKDSCLDKCTDPAGGTCGSGEPKCCADSGETKTVSVSHFAIT